MDITAVQTDLVARLNAQIPTVPTRDFPDDPQNTKMLLPTAEHLLRYLGSSAAPPEPNRIGSLEQLDAHEYEVTIRSRNLRPKDGHKASYPLMPLVRAALVGFTPTAASVPVPDASRIYFVRQGFVQEYEGIWEYNVVVGFTAPEVTA